MPLAAAGHGGHATETRAQMNRVFPCIHAGTTPGGGDPPFRIAGGRLPGGRQVLSCRWRHDHCRSGGVNRGGRSIGGCCLVCTPVGPLVSDLGRRGGNDGHARLAAQACRADPAVRDHLHRGRHRLGDHSELRQALASSVGWTGIPDRRLGAGDHPVLEQPGSARRISVSTARLAQSTQARARTSRVRASKGQTGGLQSATGPVSSAVSPSAPLPAEYVCLLIK